MSDEKGYLYRVGWLATEESDADGQGGSVFPKGRLTILGDYTATNAAAAVKMALEDGETNGGVPSMAGQRMVAVPVSRWSEFGGSARQTVEWDVVPIVSDGEQIPGQTAIE